MWSSTRRCHVELVALFPCLMTSLPPSRAAPSAMNGEVPVREGEEKRKPLITNVVSTQSTTT